MTDLDRIIAEMEAACPAYAGPDVDYSVDASKVHAWAHALRLAALAGAAPVAWRFSLGANRTWFDCPVPDLSLALSAGTNNPIEYAYPHAPAKAREVSEADVRRACNEYAQTMAHQYGEGEANMNAMRAALATFAEGA